MLVVSVCWLWPGQSLAATKNGVFMNPITDVSYQEIFPLKIAGLTVFNVPSNYDTFDATKRPVCICPAPPPLMFRPGIPISLWEPARAVETVKTPFYFPFIGTGLAGLGSAGTLGGTNDTQADGNNGQYTFSQAHYFIFPVWTALELLLDFVCLEHSGIDLAYITEIDPMWNDDSLSAILNPEAMLFGNPVAQLACIADSVSTNAWRPLDFLFWCMGSSGSAYPLTGSVGYSNNVQASAATVGKMIYKLSRTLMICDTNISACGCVPTPIWVKSNYKYHMVRPTRRLKAHPIGKSSLFYEAGSNPLFHSGLGPSDEYLWMLFRKRTCCAL